MKHKNLYFAFLLFLYYSRYCILYSFSTVFFQEQGFSAAGIGQLAAISGLVVVFAGPAAGALSDRLNSERKVILSCLFLTLFFTVSVYLGRKDFRLLFFLYGAVSFFDKAVSPLFDSWIVGCEEAEYGKIRAIGSLGGALCAVGTGTVIDRYGFGTVFGIHIGLTFLLIVAVIKGNENRKSPGTSFVSAKKESAADDQRKEDANDSILSWSAYAALLFIMTVLFTGVTAEVTYFPLLFQAAGGCGGQLGAALFFMSVSELTGMTLYKKFRRRALPVQLLFFSLLIYTCKLGMQVRLQNVGGLIFLQILQAGGYGTLLPAVTEMITGLVPKKNRAAALSGGFACMQGAGVVAGNWLAGSLCQAYGIKRAYVAGTLLCLTASVLYGIVFHRGIRDSFRIERKRGDSEVS